MKTTFKPFVVTLLLASAASALADVHYVDVNSTNATPPYTNWTTAATNIQDAVDAAVAGDEIVVTNGVYANGGQVVDGWPNRVAVDKPLSLRSVNGPADTLIIGDYYSVRCVYLTNSASLSGFTLTGGSALQGGGVFCESVTAVVSNCVVSDNTTWVPYPLAGGDSYGGGAYGGTLNNCTLTGNWLAGPSGGSRYGVGYGGGAYNCTLNNCALTGNTTLGFKYYDDAYGGGAAYCTLNNCTLTGNSVLAFELAVGGGAYRCTLKNCTLTGNSADATPGYSEAYGGGVAFCTLNNCTLSDNFLGPDHAVGLGSGAYFSVLINCIIYFNGYLNYYGSTLNYCCTTPLPINGVGNITNAPLFVNGDFRLQSNSPCINAGLNVFAPAGPDLDGNPRIVGGTVDIGAYEFQSLDLINSGVVSNQFGFNITGQSNWVIVLEASSDFTNWTPLTTNTLSGSPFPFRDPAPPNLPQRFYRARME